jgi:hypothetical protein
MQYELVSKPKYLPIGMDPAERPMRNPLYNGKNEIYFNLFFLENKLIGTK